jgi:hypothetical protein
VRDPAAHACRGRAIVQDIERERSWRKSGGELAALNAARAALIA